jgi:hypothetical protein
LSDLYEFEITGTIGPLIRSCLPELDTVTESASTMLTGTVCGPDELRRVLDLLDAHGAPALDVRITRHRDDPATSSGGAAGQAHVNTVERLRSRGGLGCHSS